jgi:hypothetical protein
MTLMMVSMSIVQTHRCFWFGRTLISFGEDGMVLSTAPIFDDFNADASEYVFEFGSMMHNEGILDHGKGNESLCLIHLKKGLIAMNVHFAPQKGHFVGAFSSLFPFLAL